MNWAELKALDPALITLGAHSTNHPILANCTATELANEVVVENYGAGYLFLSPESSAS